MDIKNIQKELKNQDNRCTQDPIYYVMDTRMVICHPDNHDGTCYYIHHPSISGVYLTREAAVDFCKDCELSEEEIDKSISEENFKYNRFVRQVFFTNKSAEEYIKNNKHNLENPYIYVDSLYGNPEMKAIRKWILEMDFKK